jgi:hypothetical protein
LIAAATKDAGGGPLLTKMPQAAFVASLTREPLQQVVNGT